MLTVAGRNILRRSLAGSGSSSLLLCSNTGRSGQLPLQLVEPFHDASIAGREQEEVFFCNGHGSILKGECRGESYGNGLADLESITNYALRLQSCIERRDVTEGRELHNQIIDDGYAEDNRLGNTLVRMYAKCGCLEDAHDVFKTLSYRDGLTWSALISANVKYRRRGDAATLFQHMKVANLSLNSRTLVSILKACGSLMDLKHGSLIHAKVVQMGLETNMYVASSLISMYMNCRSLGDAVQVFDKLTEPDVLSWNAMIAGYTDNGRGEAAMTCFNSMLQRGLDPSPATFVSILKACANLGSLENGKHIHLKLIELEYDKRTVVGNSLLQMYAKCGSLNDARQVFDNLTRRDVVSWSAMIAACSHQAQAEEGITLFHQMQHEGLEPNIVTLVNILKACTNLESLEFRKVIHDYITKSGCETDILVGTTLIDMYAKHGSILDASKVFENMHQRDLVSWNAMITGFSQHGHSEEAFVFFSQMMHEGLKPNDVTFLSMLQACSDLRSLEHGKCMHAKLMAAGYSTQGVVGNTLVHMYANCDSLQDARQVFDRLNRPDVISWNAMIGGYAQQNLGEEALKLFVSMQEQGCRPDNVTFVTVLKACESLRALEQGIKPNSVTVVSILKAIASVASPAALEQGRRIHTYITEHSLDTDQLVGSTLVNMYASCGSPNDALLVFQTLPRHDVVAWNAMISGYANAGDSQKALNYFHRMQEEGMKPDCVTYISALKACTAPDCLIKGQMIHSQLIQEAFAADMNIGNALITMYVNCGCLLEARKVFDRLPNRDLISWNSMIAGYSQNGHLEKARELLGMMSHGGIKPNNATFASLLTGCANYACLDEGNLVYASVTELGFEMDVLVGNHLIYMYSKCGSLGDACIVFEKMPKGNVVTWNTMISSYGQHGFGYEAVQCFTRMQSEGVKANSVTFLCLLSACSHAGLVDEGYEIFKCITAGEDMQPTMEQYAAMVDILGRAGRLDEAEAFVYRMPLKPDVVVWTSLLGACKIHGNIDIGRRSANQILKLEPENYAAYLLLGGMLATAGLWDELRTLKKVMKDSGVKKMVRALSWIDVDNKVHSFGAGETVHPNSIEIIQELRRLRGTLEHPWLNPSLHQ